MKLKVNGMSMVDVQFVLKEWFQKYWKEFKT